MPREFAHSGRRRAGIKSVEAVPEFQRHLERNGIGNLAGWKARNKGASTDDGDALSLSARYLKVRPRQ